LVGEEPDSDEPEEPWRRELGRRKGDEKGYYSRKGAEKGNKGDEKGYKGKGQPGKGRKGPQGHATAFGTMWAGWGPTGGQAAETDMKENDGNSDFMLMLFCAMLVLFGMGLASRTIRRPLARMLRGIAFLIDEGAVSAQVVFEPFSALHEAEDSASVRAMPARAEAEIRPRTRCMRKAAAHARDRAAGEPFTPVETLDQGSQSLDIKQQRHCLQHQSHGHDMRTQTRWLVDSGCGVDMGTQTVDKNFWLGKVTVYELNALEKDQGLQTTGLKQDLIWRIEQHRASLAGR
jgi:hypothetical protein